MTEQMSFILEVVTVIVALLCYAFGAPNAGHFFMFCIAITKLDNIEKQGK